MLRVSVAALVLLPVAASAQSVQPGGWEVTSTARELVIPGAPGFMLRMMRGKSRAERKCVALAQAANGMAALLTPAAKGKCRQEAIEVAGGRYAQTLICPQPEGRTLRVVRSGRYDANGFSGSAVMTGETKKGAMRVVLDQAARRTGAECRR